MGKLALDASKNIAVFINDFDQEFADALEKLAVTLARPLRGIILIDSVVKRAGTNTPDVRGIFQQIECDFSDNSALRATVRQFEDNLLLVTASADRNQPYLQRLLPHVPYLYGPTESSLSWSTHKGKMREMLVSYAPELAPKFVVVESASEREVRRIVTALKFPLIIKPTGLAASILVSKAHDLAELRSVLQKSFAVIHDVYERDSGRGQPSMIIEEFIEGEMYSVDVYVGVLGQIWSLPLLRATTGYTVGRPGFSLHQVDSAIELDAQAVASAQAAVEAAVHALGLRACVVHIELFHTSTGWKVIELAPRAGGQRQDVYLAAYGIDHAYNEFLLKVGLEPEISQTPIAFISAIYFYPETEGTIEAIEGFEEVTENPSVYKMTLFGKPGDLALMSHNGGKMVARGVLANPDLGQLKRDTESVRTGLKIITKQR